MSVNVAFYLVLVMLAGGFLAAALRVLREYERAVMFTLGRFTGVIPGLMIMVPVIQQMVRVDLRTRVLDVPQQDVISRDVSVKANAVVYFRGYPSGSINHPSRGLLRSHQPVGPDDVAFGAGPARSR